MLFHRRAGVHLVSACSSSNIPTAATTSTATGRAISSPAAGTRCDNDEMKPLRTTGSSTGSSFAPDLLVAPQPVVGDHSSSSSSLSWMVQFGCRTWPVLVLDLVRLLLAVVVLLPGFVRFAWYYWIVAKHETVSYAVDSCRQRLDVYKSQQPVPAAPQQHNTETNHHNHKSPLSSSSPVIVFIPGGGWMIGYKLWGALLARSLLRVGHVTIVMMDYRNYPVGTVPQQVEDIECALVWTKRNIHKYGGDASRIVLVGESAGGHLAALLLLQKDLRSQLQTAATAIPNGETTTTTTFDLADCKGLVTMAAPLDLSCMSATYEKHGLDRDSLQRIFGGHLQQCDPLQLVLQQPLEKLSESSSRTTTTPTHNKNRLTSLPHLLPPMLICQGTKDKTVPWQGAKAFCDALQQRHVRVDLQLYEGWSHTQANVEGPMQGDYSFHRHVFQAVQTWTTSAAKNSAAEPVVTTATVDEEEELVWQELGHLCPTFLVQLGTLLMPV